MYDFVRTVSTVQPAASFVSPLLANLLVEMIFTLGLIFRRARMVAAPSMNGIIMSVKITRISPRLLMKPRLTFHD